MKACVDCKHFGYSAYGFARIGECFHDARLNPITGDRIGDDPLAARHWRQGSCGVEARNFEPKPITNWRPLIEGVCWLVGVPVAIILAYWVLS